MSNVTDNYGFKLPDFNTTTWHDAVNQNFQAIDTLIKLGTGLSSVKGAWTNAITYAVNDRVLDPSDGSLWQAKVNHISAVAGTFAADRLANPTYWLSVGNGWTAMGAWQNNQQYQVGDTAYDTSENLYCVCKTQHISNIGGTLRTDIANWTILLDGKATITTATNNAAAAATAVLATKAEQADLLTAISNFNTSLATKASTASVALKQDIATTGQKAGIRNEIMNGNFDFWQRFTTTGSWTAPVLNYYTADRWVANSAGTGGNGVLSQQTFTLGQTDVPGNPIYFLRWQVTSAASGQSSNNCYIEQRMENVQKLAARKVTVTLYLKGTGTMPLIYMNQIFGSGGSAPVQTVLASNVALQAGWTKYQYVVDLPSIAGKTVGTDSYTSVGIVVPPNTTYTLDIAHVSVVRGDASGEDDPFPAVDYPVEELRCKRFYEKTHRYVWQGYSAASNNISSNAVWAVPKRKVPDVAFLFNSNVSTGVPALGTPTKYGVTIQSLKDGNTGTYTYSAELAVDAEL